MVTAASVGNVTQVDKLLHGVEGGRCADTVYTGGEKREEQPDELVAARCSTYQKYGKRITLYKAIRRIEKAKARVRAEVERPSLANIDAVGNTRREGG